MRPALVLVDLQADFLDRRALHPWPDEIVARSARLLGGCRERGLPVIHVHTVVSPDGDDRMPHWKRADRWECVEGTPGARPPGDVAPRGDEVVIRKRGYDPFSSSELEATLRAAGVDTVIVAGLYLHACVRATALGAYERGWSVWIAGDAIGTTEPDHAELVRIHLAERAARFLDVERILVRIRGQLPVDDRSDEPDTDAARAVATAVDAAGAWAARLDRAGVLLEWATALEARSGELVELLADEVGKPVRDGATEVRFALALLREAATRSPTPDGVEVEPGEVEVRHRPHGVVAAITPWNNPIALPIGKIAPALALGNTVVWKAAPETPRAARAVLATLRAGGAPDGVVELLSGAGAVVRAAIDDPRVAAVAFTGSTAVGHALAARCLRRGKPFQGELGGNNAAIVLADADPDATASGLVAAAFANAGQRCTAIRRILIERSAYAAVRDALVAATASLRVGDPRADTTDVGPLVTAAHRARVARRIVAAIADGGRLLIGGGAPPGLEGDRWLEPTLIDGVAATDRIVREESFGPVAVLLPFDGIDEAIALANGVEQGLLAAVLTSDAERRDRIADAVAAGLVTASAGPLAVHPAAPFGGWKTSGVGPPEHGRWDLEAWARPQARYGFDR